MKVAINLTVHVDRDEWRRAHGTAATHAAVRSSLIDEVVNGIYRSNTDRGIPVSVVRK